MIHASTTPQDDRVVLRLDDVCEALSGWTGIAVQRLTPSRMTFDDFDSLRRALEERIFGQERAIDAVVAGVQRHFRLSEREGVRRPIWTALFVGPSGVGKTQLARELAAHFFGDPEKHLVKIDLSELREEHTIARLVGAPPGYKGHGDGGELTNALRLCASGVLLFDEVEKAHPTILSTVILPIIGDGVVHDMNDGRTLDVTNMVVAMTSNLGTNRIEERPAGFGRTDESVKGGDEEAVRTAVHQYFPREVLGRIDDIVVFSPLSDDAVRRVWRREVAALEGRLSQPGGAWRVAIELRAENMLLEHVAAGVRREGARAVVRFFDRAIVDRCLDLLRHSEGGSGTIRVEASAEAGTLRYSIVEADDNAG